MKYLKNYWYNKKIWTLIFILIILMVFRIVSSKIDSSNDYDNIKNRINNKYNPVRITDTVPAGGVDEDENGRKKAEAVFYIKNYTQHDQKVTVLLYQHNLNENQLFDLEHVYTIYDLDTKVEMENGVIKIPGGEKMKIHAEGIARDHSKVQTSEMSPSVKVIKLN